MSFGPVSLRTFILTGAFSLALASSLFVHAQQGKFSENAPAIPPKKLAQQQAAQRLTQDLHVLMALGMPGTWEAFATIAAAQQLQRERDELAFWGSQRHAQAAAAAQLVLAQHPFTVFALRTTGKELSVWHEQAYILDKALALNQTWLHEIRDGTPLPDFRPRSKDQRRVDEIAIYNAYCQAVLFSYQTPLDAFKKSAQENKAVTFAHLWDEPAKYRGEVIYFKGRLKRLRKWDAPIPLQKRGIRSVYEGWVFGPTRGSTPYCVVFPIPAEDSSSPGGLLEPVEETERWVEFYGYFLKKMRYRSGEGDKETPLLIGPTLILVPRPPEPIVPPPTKDLLALFIGFGACIAGLMLFLTLWFRKGDRQFHNRLQDYHNARVADMLAEGTPDDPLPNLEEKPPP